jgi:hypothetical protein
MIAIPDVQCRPPISQRVRSRHSQEEIFLDCLFGVLTVIWQHIPICINI